MTERQVALVTGGSRGIGRAVAVRLAADGYDIAFCYRSGADAAAQTEKLVREAGAQVHHAPCDVADFDAVQEFVSETGRRLGPVAALVNSAGVVRDNPMVLMPVEDWHTVIDTNLTGTFNFCRSVGFGFMKRKQGVIVNMSSIAGVYGHATQSNYAASKAGIQGMSASLAKEVASYGIRVNVVAPGFIETDMTDRLPEKVRAEALKSIPLKRYGGADEVADLVSFLVSDRAAYITGEVIQIDGGVAL
ncbi:MULTISPECIES: 3-oxoacyl-[acyl-carrier-protein] reductase [unclassified Streptomyces]|uniref:3-oxoacyl-[acyl-carrier-protein] reductase n=1 Tax=unclassified Streptomyces TaxID=2593676 RepID=UPI0022592BC1|nr:MULTISPECIES: 3-oxoacyl-[acyl-carrier-protein] reductase [unclassified Streptomyces]MCX5049437.1 3-oxoacyl-[acyl-carrier-protein] reductase [Streptomyces sp. NBC_00474]MCX5055818.1 3-oxoacyl-[acyl-carrier-protein] reductase [Streptomyces sp. NBC_00452]MCX5247323.1 3-oxoacyl-[acyl-carrier-protein] reductase [Streptomyces sp. NBC_00201]MCX5286895.1 3-oxoacyl-[acyl-carrier-protein] reductase [Streptomyces sp. NBC_00183]